MPEQNDQPAGIQHRNKAEQNGFTPMPNAVLHNPDIPGMVRLCYLTLKSYAYGSKDSSFPGQQSLSASLGVSTRSVHDYIDLLCQYGLISIERRGLGLTNMYWIEVIPDDLDQRVKSVLDRKLVSDQDRKPTSDKEYKNKENKIPENTTNVVLAKPDVAVAPLVVAAPLQIPQESAAEVGKPTRKRSAKVPKVENPETPLSRAMHEAIPDNLRPPKCHYGKHATAAKEMLAAGYTADDVGVYVRWLYATDTFYKRSSFIVSTAHVAAKINKHTLDAARKWDAAQKTSPNCAPPLQTPARVVVAATADEQDAEMRNLTLMMESLP